MPAMASEYLKSAAKIRVFVVDDEPVVRRGLQLFFRTHPRVEVCGEAANEREALEGILRTQPDLAVVDLSLEEGDGFSLIKRLHARLPTLRILVFSMHDEVQFASAAFRAGAHGYITKEEGSGRLLDAIQALMDGHQYLCERIAAKAPHLFPNLEPRLRFSPSPSRKNPD
jgi:DNA-binding NarL/FixJ family response regulator